MRSGAGLQCAEEVVALLDLAPHPEGGFYRETFRDPAVDESGRSRSTVIYFLLDGRSHWHRVDAVESWFWHAGAPLRLLIGKDEVTLGPDLAAGQRPQGVVPKDEWQAAETLGDWTLVSCTVAPAFDFAGFELAPNGWSPT
jgi:predicted cupin superfamily sugar epimerase